MMLYFVVRLRARLPQTGLTNRQYRAPSRAVAERKYFNGALTRERFFTSRKICRLHGNVEVLSSPAQYRFDAKRFNKNLSSVSADLTRESDTTYGAGMASAPESLLNNSTTSRSRGKSRIAFSSSSGGSGVGSSPTSFLNSA